MSKVKTSVVDVSKTTPEAFLTGSAPPETPPASTPMPPETAALVATPETPLPVADQNQPVTSPEKLPGLDTPIAPNRPGLETPQVQIAETDPFTLLRAWKLTNEQGSSTFRSLRAIAVPGGCIVRHSTLAGAALVESICFVKNCKIENGELVPA